MTATPHLPDLDYAVYSSNGAARVSGSGWSGATTRKHQSRVARFLEFWFSGEKSPRKFYSASSREAIV